VDSASVSGTSRRGLLGAACVVSGCALCAMAGAPVVKYLAPQKGKALKGPQNVAASEEIPDGGSKLFVLGSLYALVVRTAGKLAAVNATCTHAGCIIEWDGKAGIIKCNCHGAQFETSGRKISGPAKDQAPLEVREAEGRIILDLK